jgi:hypothetical protein
VLCCPGDVTLQVDFRNAFNSVSRQALLQAVASRAPHLLPCAARICWSHGPLVIQAHLPTCPRLPPKVGRAKGIPAVPCSSPWPHRAPWKRDAFSDVYVLAYADDVLLQEAAIEVFWLLGTATAPIGLAPSLLKCAAYARSAATGLAVASALGVTYCPEGLFSCRHAPQLGRICRGRCSLLC